MHNYTFWEAASGDRDTPPASVAHWWLSLPPPNPPLLLPVQAPFPQPTCSKSGRLPLISSLSPAPSATLKRDKELFIWRKDKPSKCQPVTDMILSIQEQGGRSEAPGFLVCGGLSPATHTPATLCTLTYAQILPAWPFGFFSP